ncbi:hypothetical protein Bbelb_287470 [Branchiostoma belcheri]|nr:hypothetical protein Bbelb_287470 [Branchiostoma belcheri]
MFWKAVLSAATALPVFFSCRCTLPVGAPNTPPTGRAVVHGFVGGKLKQSTHRDFGDGPRHFWDFEKSTTVLAEAAGRALGGVLGKVKVLKDLGYYTYTQLYEACVCPILDYAAGVWGYKTTEKCSVVQNRAIRCFLGVHRFAPVLATTGDMAGRPVK